MVSERKIVADNLKRVLLKEYMMRETSRAGFGGLDIQRTPMGTRITLFAERPGIVIGRRGVTIKALTNSIDENFALDNPQIEVEEVGNPALNAQIMAEKLASALERGWHFRRAGHSTLRRIMESGAKGALVKISGKLTSRRHRTQKFKAGHIKYCGEPKIQFVAVGFAIARLKKGVIGVTVWITDPNAKLPDEIEVEAPAKVEEPPVVEVEEPVAEEAAEAQEETKRTEKKKSPGQAEKKSKRLKKAAEDPSEEMEPDHEEGGKIDEPKETPEGDEEAEAEGPVEGDE